MMKHTIKFSGGLTYLLFALSTLLIGCAKDIGPFNPPTVAFFNTPQAAGNYTMTTATQVFKLPVGITAARTEPTTFNIAVASPSGAVVGTHFNLSASSITLAPGQVTDTVVVTGVFNQYTSGRKDVYVFTIDGTGVPAASFRNTFTLNVQGPCFEGDVDLDLFAGNYANTNEDFGGAYGPYTTSVSNIVKTSATTGTIRVSNIFNYGWNPVTFKLDWTDPTNRTVTLDPQTGIGNAGTINGDYEGDDIQVRAYASNPPGTFSICNQTITIRMQLGVTGLGFFTTLYTLNMAR